MAPKSLAVLVLALTLVACGSDDDGGSVPTTTRARQGCPVPPSAVADAVGHPVAVERRPSGTGSCAYVGDDDASAGARVEVAVRALRDQDPDDALAEVERRAGPATPLADGAVDGAEEGWVAVAGRAVQVGAVAGNRLVVVAVAEPGLDAAAAEEVATRLAAEALDR